MSIKFNKKEQADLFVASFNAAKQYNQDIADGKEGTEAPEVEDLDEVQEDDIDVNKTADKEGEWCVPTHN